MKRKISAAVCSLVLILNIFSFGTCVSAEGNTACVIADGIYAYQMELCGAKSVQEWIDTGLTENAGLSSEWYVIALHQSGTGYDFSKYSSSLARYLKEGRVFSGSTMAKYALAFMSADCSCDYIEKAAAECIGSSGIMNHIFGMHLLCNGVSSPSETAESLAEKIVSLQHDDGGYGLSDASDVDVTAMTVQALASMYEQPDIGESVDRAIDFLSAAQHDDGTFSSFGTVNSESVSQVIIAMSALGISIDDPRFVKAATALDALMTFRLEDGGFSHVYGGETSNSATVQAYLAATALIRAENGRGSLYLLDEYEDNTPPDIPSFLSDDAAEDEEKQPISYKLWATIAVVTAAMLVSCAFVISGKRGMKNHVFVICVAVVLIAVIFFTDIQSANAYYDGGAKVKDPVGTVEMSIECKKIEGKSGAPGECIVLSPSVFEIEAGDTVYSVLVRAARANGLLIENNGSRKLAYISGISGVYELEYGELSGWIYTVNGVIASVTCSEYVLSDGDVIGWHYTLDLGHDIETE